MVHNVIMPEASPFFNETLDNTTDNRVCVCQLPCGHFGEDVEVYLHFLLSQNGSGRVEVNLTERNRETEDTVVNQVI